MSTDPFTPPPPPPVERLNRSVLLAAALIVVVTLLAVAFLAAPRAPQHPTAPAAPRLTAGAPGFLRRPPGALPPAPRPPVADADYLRNLLEQASAAAHAQPATLAPLAAPFPPPAAATAAPPPPAAPPAPPRDPRKDAFLRALRAPLAQSIPPALPAGAAAAALGAPAPATGDAATPPDRASTSALSDGLAGLATPTAAPPSPAAAAASTPPPANGTLASAPLSPLAAAALAPAYRPIAARGGAGGANLANPASGAYLAPAALAASAATSGAAAGAPSGDRSLPAVQFHLPGATTTLAAGTLIPALLETEVNSDLPGPLLAQVSRDVYDATQQTLLIPRGARLIGRYQNQVAIGQNRLLVAWTRLAYPDGAVLDLPGLPGLDPNGAAGLTARTQNHLLRLFGDALLLSLLSAAADLSQPQQGDLALAPSAGSVASAAVGQQLANVGVQLLQRDISLQPTLHLAAGTPFLIFVNGDLPLGAAVAHLETPRP